MASSNIAPPRMKFAPCLPTRLFPAIALLLPMLGGCSKSVSIAPIPALQANLSQPCQVLPSPPDPLNDPARAVWEMDLIAAFGDCAAKVLAIQKAWPKPE